MLFEGTCLTFSEFHSWVGVIAADLLAHGVQPGDRFVIQVPNSLEALVLQIAAFRIGVVNVPIVPIYREHELAHILADARPSAIAVAAELGSRRPPEEVDGVLAQQDHVVRVKYALGTDRPAGWMKIPERPSPGTPIPDHLPDPVEASAPALYLYTLGTTSLPKGAILSSRACIAHVRNFTRRFWVTVEDALLAGTPLSHLGGFFNSIMMPLYTGARVVILPAWRPREAGAPAEAEGVTLTTGAALFLRDLVELYEAGEFASKSLRIYSSAGAYTERSLVRRAASFGVTAIRGYGMTEAGAVAGGDARDPDLMREEYDGRVFDGMTIQSVDEDRRVLPFGVDGELRIQGPQVMDGYTDPVASALHLDDDGWFYTGDIGSVTDDGWVRMSGRIKNIINRGGEKFSAQDIESAILQHPDVKEVAVTGVPEPRLGEKVAAFVTLKDGADWTGPDEILAVLDQQGLAKPKFPVVWHVLPEGLSRNPTGKIKKNVLVELHESQPPACTS